MSRQAGYAALILIASAAGAAAQPPSAVTAGGITLRSESFAPPTSDRGLPGGAAADVATANCTTCHSVGMILNQPALSAATWG